MNQELKSAIKKRRTYYSISNQSLISDQEIQDLIEVALKDVPSAFNSQSTRIVLLLGKHHQKLWQIVKESLKKIVPEEAFSQTEEKIDGCFAAGYGTVLFFEDQSVVKGLQEAFATYKDNFPIWSEQTAGMHQLIVWTLLEENGFGASLQHYNPLIDEAVREEWKLSADWKLTAQMPFGVPLSQPGEKTFEPFEKRLKIFK